MALPTQVQKLADKTDSQIKDIKEGAVKSVEETEDKAVVESIVEEPEHREQKPPAKTDTEETWEQRYRALQGKYDHEIKAIQDDVNLLSSLKHQVRVLNQQLHEGDVVVRELKDKLEQKESVPTPEKAELPYSIASHLTKDERSHLEEEGIDEKSIEIIGRVITDKVSSISKPDNAQSIDLEEIKKNAAVIKQNKVNTFWEKLSNKVNGVPDWETVNSSDGFNDWLDNFIPYTTITRRYALKSAEKQLDHEKVIEIFNGFKKEHPQKPKPEPLKINPEEHLDPAATVDTSGVKEKQRTTYTKAEVKQFYVDCVLNKYSEEEKKSIDADILKASKEGRITN